jgi:hypothetical protein
MEIHFHATGTSLSRSYKCHFSKQFYKNFARIHFLLCPTRFRNTLQPLQSSPTRLYSVTYENNKWLHSIALWTARFMFTFYSIINCSVNGCVLLHYEMLTWWLYSIALLAVGLKDTFHSSINSSLIFTLYSTISWSFNFTFLGHNIFLRIVF